MLSRRMLASARTKQAAKASASPAKKARIAKAGRAQGFSRFPGVSVSVSGQDEAEPTGSSATASTSVAYATTVLLAASSQVV